jgi:hypothetical protein
MKPNAYKSIMILLMIVFLPTLIQSCCTEDLESYYDVTGINIRNIEGGLNTTPATSTKPAQYFYKEVDSVETSKYGLLVEPQIRYYSVSQFSSALYACSPDPGGKGTKERIETIQITSSQDFDEGHLAGNSLNDLFLLSYPSGAQEEVELNQFLQTNPRTIQYEIILKLKRKPDKSSIHQFTIKYSHTDGETFEQTTKPVKLL